MLKVKVFGYRGKFNSTVRVEQELVRQGCELVNENPDLLIELCGLFSDAQTFYKTCSNKPIRLYNLLDVMNRTPNFYDQAKLDYEEAEITTTISNVVKKDIQKKFQTNKDIHVIGFPIRDIQYSNYGCKGVPFCYVGRISDPNKRVGLIKPTLERLNFNHEMMVFVGSEKPPFGMWAENLSDPELSEMYNCADFVFLPSQKEGLGLTAMETIIGGGHPLLCDDNPLVKELGLSAFSAAPHPVALGMLVNKIQKDYPKYRKIIDELRPKFQKQFSIEKVVKSMLELYNNYIKENLNYEKKN